jgi:hypothetical protein
MRTYTEIQDESTSWEEVVRIEDDGALVEDVKVWDADQHVIELFELSSRHLASVRRALDEAEDTHRLAAKALTQNVWRKRGGK